MPVEIQPSGPEGGHENYRAWVFSESVSADIFSQIRGVEMEVWERSVGEQQVTGHMMAIAEELHNKGQVSVILAEPMQDDQGVLYELRMLDTLGYPVSAIVTDPEKIDQEDGVLLVYQRSEFFYYKQEDGSVVCVEVVYRPESDDGEFEKVNEFLYQDVGPDDLLSTDRRRLVVAGIETTGLEDITDDPVFFIESTTQVECKEVYTLTNYEFEGNILGRRLWSLSGLSYQTFETSGCVVTVSADYSESVDPEDKVRITTSFNQLVEGGTRIIRGTYFTRLDRSFDPALMVRLDPDNHMLTPPPSGVMESVVLDVIFSNFGEFEEPVLKYQGRLFKARKLTEEEVMVAWSLLLNGKLKKHYEHVFWAEKVDEGDYAALAVVFDPEDFQALVVVRLTSSEVESLGRAVSIVPAFDETGVGPWDARVSLN